MEWIDWIGIALATHLGVAFLSAIFVDFQSDKWWMKKCVEHKAAHWETATDGSTTFKWNEEPTE